MRDITANCEQTKSEIKKILGKQKEFAKQKERKTRTTEPADTKNVSLSFRNSFCLKSESKVKGLPNQAKRLQVKRRWMRSYEQLKDWEEIVISSDNEQSRQDTVSSATGPSTSRARSSK